MKFDGFKRQDFDGISAFCRQHFKVPVELKQVSTRGYNWGNIDFETSQMTFSVGELEAFEIPLNQVAGTKVQGKNEVTIEFQPSKAKTSQDSLVEVRFYVPGTITQGQVIDDGESKILRDKEMVDGDDEGDLDGEQGEISKRAQEIAVDESGQELNAAQLLVETIKQKSNIDETSSELIVELEELLCLTPRGRFQIDFHEDFFRLRGKSNDYRIYYNTIMHLFLLPKPDDMHWSFVISLNPPLRQGNTRYPFLVFQFDREDEVEATLNISEEKLAASNGRLEKEYDGPTYRVVSDLFSGLSTKSIIGASQAYSRLFILT